MRNPWVHDDEDVDVSAGATSQSAIRWIGVLVWSSLAILLTAIGVTAGDQLTIPPFDQLVSILFTVLGGVLFLLFVVPVLLKLLRISRLLTAFVVFGSVGLGARVLIGEGSRFAAEYQSLIEAFTRGFHDAVRLSEALSVLI